MGNASVGSAGCHYLDREHSYAEGEAPATWTCPECGGTEWDLVRMVVDFVTPDDPRVQHSNRFRHVSNRYPYMVAMAYDRDLAAAAADSDEEVAARVAAYERAQGLKPRDWYAIGAEERN
jgi:hypothetical protein